MLGNRLGCFRSYTRVSTLLTCDSSHTEITTVLQLHEQRRGSSIPPPNARTIAKPFCSSGFDCHRTFFGTSMVGNTARYVGGTSSRRKTVVITEERWGLPLRTEVTAVGVISRGTIIEGARLALEGSV